MEVKLVICNLGTLFGYSLMYNANYLKSSGDLLKANKPVSQSKRKLLNGWGAAFFLLCASMFILGVLVGRGTISHTFDIAAMQKDLENLKKAVYKANLKEQNEQKQIEDKPKILDMPDHLRSSSTQRQDDALLIPANKAENKSVVKKKQKPTDPKPRPVVEPEPNNDAKYTIQVAAFRNSQDANRLVTKLKRDGYDAYKTRVRKADSNVFYRVRIGAFATRSEAFPTMKRLRKEQKDVLLVQK